MRVFSVIPPVCGCLLLAASATSAQEVPRAFEGTISQASNGATVRARVWSEAPDKLRVEVEPNHAAGVLAQTVVASGDETFVFEPATKRLRRLPFNALENWHRSSDLIFGGPANFALAGAKTGTFGADTPQIRRREQVLFGGRGGNAYYAARSALVPQFPTVELRGAPISERIETRRANEQTTFGLAWNGAVPDAATSATTSFDYDLRAVEDVPDSQFSLPDTQNALAQDELLNAPSSYQNDAFNRALALWSAAEDAPASLALLDEAARKAPQASGPSLAAFEIALATRQLEAARRALGNLEKTGVSPLEIEARRARLALARRDLPTALSALETGLKTAPDAVPLQLLRAEALRASGRIDDARTLWRAVWNNEAAPAVARVTAVENYVAASAPDEWKTLAGALEGDSALVSHARALFGLRAQNSATSFGPRVETALDRTLTASLARALERAGRNTEALTAWNALADAPESAFSTQARARATALLIRGGDGAAALTQFGRWTSSLGTAEREAARSALFDVAQKSGQRRELGALLANRALATRASSEDARLHLSFLEAFGTDEEIERAVQSAAARFATDPFWLSRRAERLLERAVATSATTTVGERAQDALLNQSRELLDRAVAAAPDDLFLKTQRALVDVQAAGGMGITDAGRAVESRATAKASVEKLLASAPDDPDVKLAAALGLLTVGGDAETRRALELATQALDSDPNRGLTHAFASAARQTLASAARKANRGDLVASQYGALLLGATNAGEQVGIAANALSPLVAANDAASVAALLTRVAEEPWNYAEARALLEALSARVAGSPLATPVVATLAQNPAPAARLAWATFASVRLNRARRALEVPSAPASADAELERASLDAQAALAALREVEKAEPFVLARILALRAENAPDAESGFADLRRAIALEPNEPSLRFALITALAETDQASAKTAWREAAQALPWSEETARGLALAALAAGEKAAASSLAQESYAAALLSPGVGANAFQRVAFARARIAWENGEAARASEIYTLLADEEWAPVDRAAALLALRARYLESSRNAEAAALTPRIQALALSLEELEQAAAFVQNVES